MRQPGRGGRCRPRSLGAWPRGTASASGLFPFVLDYPEHAEPRVRPGRQRLVVASGCQEREIRPCSSPMTASWDAAVPMRRRISSNARCPRSGFVLAARACNRRDEPERGRLGDRQAQAPAGGPCTGLALLLSLSMAQFMVVLDFTIVNVALPSIQRDLHVATTTLQWLVSAYAVACGGFLLLGGSFADAYGRARLYRIGLVVFVAAAFPGVWPSGRDC